MNMNNQKTTGVLKRKWDKNKGILHNELHIIDDKLMMLRRQGFIVHLETINTILHQGLALCGHLLDSVNSDWFKLAQFNKDV